LTQHCNFASGIQEPLGLLAGKEKLCGTNRQIRNTQPVFVVVEAFVVVNRLVLCTFFYTQID
jgi:hypothetical protein